VTFAILCSKNVINNNNNNNNLQLSKDEGGIFHTATSAKNQSVSVSDSTIMFWPA